MLRQMPTLHLVGQRGRRTEHGQKDKNLWHWSVMSPVLSSMAAHLNGRTYLTKWQEQYRLPCTFASFSVCPSVQACEVYVRIPEDSVHTSLVMRVCLCVCVRAPHLTALPMNYGEHPSEVFQVEGCSSTSA